jgi:alkylhydroperoxidase/carboxymuconolactone decarboxylase family protein YurZ
MTDGTEDRTTDGTAGGRDMTAEEIVEQVYRRRGYLFEWQVLLSKENSQFLLGYDQAYQAAANTAQEGSLPKKYRECVYVGVLSSMGEEQAAKNHMHKALDAGATKRELIDAVIVAWNPSGAITLVHGLKALVEVLVERGEYDYEDVPYRVTDRPADAGRTFLEDKR